MCGIAGFVGFNDSKLIRRMCKSIAHRGPDAFGFFSDKNIELGHRRLSIIDLSRRAKQPMSDKSGELWITYNGEIYNFKEIRKTLEKKYDFKTNSDTEVIIYAYKEWGTECLEKFNGMFAFAIWNSKKKELFLARDRAGVKPLYYYLDLEKLIFASEIKAILENPDIKREVNKESLNHYLSLRYVPAPETLFKGIKKLEPGCFALYKNKKLEVKRYWSASKSEKIDERKAIKDTLKYLDDSVRMRLVSDVPLGVFLSGGVDSSAAVALMSKHSDSKIKTFSVGFDDEKISETKYARAVSNIFGTEHREILMDSESMKLFPKMIWHLEEPIAAPSYIPYYYLCELARKKVTVALAGEGADELFGGYVHYKNFHLRDKIPLAIKKLISLKINQKVAESLPVSFLDKFFDYSASMGEEGKRRIIDLIKYFNDDVKTYLLNSALFSSEEKTSILAQKDLTEHLIKKEFSGKKESLAYKAMNFEIKRWLPDRILVQQDKISMAHSLEAREPFLDPRILELSYKIPDNLKFKNGIRKYVLKKALEPILPKSILYRKKVGFFVPLESWIKNDIFKKIIGENISNTDLIKDSLISKKYVEKLIERNKNPSFISSHQMFSLIALDTWYRQYIKNDSSAKTIF